MFGLIVLGVLVIAALGGGEDPPTQGKDWDGKRPGEDHYDHMRRVNPDAYYSMKEKHRENQYRFTPEEYWKNLW